MMTGGERSAISPSLSHTNPIWLS